MAQALSFDNTHVSKVAGIILIILGVYFYILHKGYNETNPMKNEMKILGIVSMVIGSAYLVFATLGGLRMLGRRSAY